ncbi:MAG: energy transducer TonB [Verrucomicrobia bacterium]|nr:energy transducer TonB [Verrucomicrobiota bacterium]
MLESRRHRLIWTAVAGVHLAAVAAVWMGGAAGVGEAAREGGLVLVTLVAEPVALPGEARGGVALGAGLPVPVAPSVVVAAPVVAPILAAQPAAAPAVSVAAAAVPTQGQVLAAAPAPIADVFVPPSFLSRQEPAYPERARRAGAEGVVGVRIALAADGSVRQVELTRSSGSRLLDEAALAAARASTFTPAARNRSPVASEAEASYRFELR